MRDWIKWNGGECPVPGETPVSVQRRSGVVESGRARAFWWNHLGWSGDIVSYRVVETEEADE